MRSVWIAALVSLAVALPARGAEFAKGDYRFSTGGEPDFVRRAEVPATWPVSAPGADEARWRYWLYDRQVDHRGGRETAFYDHVFEARSTSMLGEVGRFEIDFRPDYQTLTIHRVEVRRDGTWSSRLKPDRISLARREGEFENDMANGQVSALVVLDDVRIGDVVRIAYTLDGANPILAGQDTDGYRAGYQNPTLEVRWRGLYDPGTTLDVRASSDDDRPAIANVPGAVEATFRKSGVAALVDHGDYPRWHDPFPWVQIAPRQTWADVVTWALPLYPAVTEPLPDDLETRIARWRALPAPEERLTAALRAVQDEVRYFGIEMGEGTHRPQPPRETWSRRFGDCKDKAYLLATLLQRLGIAAAPALVSADDGKAVLGYLPSASDFDHVIVRARLSGRDVWLDPTITQQGGDARAVDLAEYGVALPIVAGTAALQVVAAPAEADDGVESVERFDLSKAGQPGALEVETVYRGASADSARRSLLSERIDSVSRRYTEYYSKRYSNVEPVAMPVIEDDRKANRIRVVERYRLGAPFKEDGDVRTLELFADSLDTPLKLPASLSHPDPLRVGVPAVYRYRAEVSTPAAWSPKFIRETSHRTSPAFEFDRSVELDADRTVLGYELTIGSRDLGGPDVAKHIAELRKARDDLYASLRYQVPVRVDGREREDRLKALLRDAMKPGASR